MSKLNCWEFKNCGREEGGENTDEFGVCPAATESRLNGINNGRNGGRSCWVIAGTLCDSWVQGTAADKLTMCRECEFYKSVDRVAEQLVTLDELICRFKKHKDPV